MISCEWFLVGAFLGSVKIQEQTTISSDLAPPPDWRNLGVVLRTLILVNLLLGLTGAVVAETMGQWWDRVGDLTARAELPLMATLLALYVLAPHMKRMQAWCAWAAVLGIGLAATSVWHLLLQGAIEGQVTRWLGWSGVAWGVVVAYFQYRSARHSPAISEARLMALTARIRPHFFFNSLNGVLGMIRSDPRRAEEALEELAELFRVLMRDNRELVTLDEEIHICRRYLDLEKLRLGERLQVRWEDNNCPGDALVPPLLLQPLLENAVYHGIEPSGQGGLVEVVLRRKGSELELEVVNPRAPSRPPSDASGHGNQLALANLRERLMLFFDLEASLSIVESPEHFAVRIRLPYRRGNP